MRISYFSLLLLFVSGATATATIIAGAAPSTAKAMPQNLTVAELMEASQPSDWRGLKAENTLYLELPGGRVVIELAPEFALHHTDNVRALARENFWDGLAIVRVQDNYVVQWADPNAEKPALKRKPKQAKETLAPEFERPFDDAIPFKALPDQDSYAPEVGFSNGFAAARDRRHKKMWLIHCYGAVGAGRDNAVDSGGGTELYAVIGQAPRHLDRNVTLLGRVVQGMELLSSLPRGHGTLGFYEKPEQNVAIKSIQVAIDVPAKERSEIEVLRTDTPLFGKLIQARRNRHEEWFHFQAGHIDVCNFPIPTREKKH